MNPDTTAGARPLVEWNGGVAGVHWWLSLGSPGSLFVSLLGTSNEQPSLATSGGVVVAGIFQHVALTLNQPSPLATAWHRERRDVGHLSVSGFGPAIQREVLPRAHSLNFPWYYLTHSRI